MRKLYFLLPGTTGKFYGGGLWAELNTYHLAQQICQVELLTYRQRESQTGFLADVLPQITPESAIFVMGWGFDVPKIIQQLRGQNIIYHAHSTNYGFTLPPQVPILAVSRHTMGYWGARANNNSIYYLPNQIAPEFRNLNQPRDIDILVQTRKSSQYLQQQLIPALQSQYRVEVIDRFVEDLAALFNRSKIYLYDSAEYWATSGVTEGFGLPPLEAIACGCQVFSSVNHGLADYLDPGFNCHKIACYSPEYDLQKIARVIEKPLTIAESFIAEYRSERLLPRLNQILIEINHFFDLQKNYRANIQSLNKMRLNQLKMTKIIRKIRQKLKRK
ncbi:MAG: glycosyltransferase [Cyanobacteria bacterium J06621_8]